MTGGLRPSFPDTFSPPSAGSTRGLAPGAGPILHPGFRLPWGPGAWPSLTEKRGEASEEGELAPARKPLGPSAQQRTEWQGEWDQPAQPEVS